MKIACRWLRSWVSAPALLVLVVAATGCGVDLAAINKFTVTSEEAGRSFPELVADMLASCVRTAQYEPDEKREAELKKCEQRRPLEPALVAAHKALMGYLQAMGTLASDNVVSYNKTLDGLKDKVQAAGKFKKEQVDAVGAIVQAVLDAATKSYRRKELRKVIQDHNGDIATLTVALKEIVGQDYKLLLSNERQAMDTFYDDNLRYYRSMEPLTALLIVRMRASDQDVLQRKVDAADAYVKVLSSIAEGHQKLYDNLDHFDSQQAVTAMLEYAQLIGDLITKLQKAFKT